MVKDLFSAIGKTPLVDLQRVIKRVDFRILAKLESLNPGGSVKDRPAFSMIKRGIESGRIGPDTVIIESSSGNMGIGLAQTCVSLGLRFICVVDPKTTQQNIRILKAYGVTVDMVTTPDPQTGEYLQARINRVKSLLASVKNSYWPDQYSNEYNPAAHHLTMQEIVEDMNNEVDYLFCSTSTCGTIRGCVEYKRMRNLATKVYAVDALGSVIFGGQRARRLIPGHGAAVRPKLYQPGLADHQVHVSDLDCIVGCRRLARREGLLVGGSSGAVISALAKVKDNIPPRSNVALIFADRGERYLDTIYSDEWVEEHFGKVSYLWEDDEENFDA